MIRNTQRDDVIQDAIIGFYNQEGVCLLRGTTECLNVIQVNLSL